MFKKIGKPRRALYQGCGFSAPFRTAAVVRVCFHLSVRLKTNFFLLVRAALFSSKLVFLPRDKLYTPAFLASSLDQLSSQPSLNLIRLSVNRPHIKKKKRIKPLHQAYFHHPNLDQPNVCPQIHHEAQLVAEKAGFS